MSQIESAQIARLCETTTVSNADDVDDAESDVEADLVTEAFEIYESEGDADS